MSDDLDIAHAHSSNHRAEVEKSDYVACFSCGSLIYPTEIEKWIDQGQTALCPDCGIDAIIGSASGVLVGRDFLDRMTKKWFS